MLSYTAVMFVLCCLFWPEGDNVKRILIHKYNVEAVIDGNRVQLLRNGNVIATAVSDDTSTPAILKWTDEVMDLRSKHLEAL